MILISPKTEVEQYGVGVVLHEQNDIALRNVRDGNTHNSI